ncbi:MAG: helix-turn-helix transcriptional regulator [Thermoleophilaceae bacterium]|nr:helix-turn-helix transcriptional regulator [Thermoleophilaceae bacterium]
MGRHQIDLPANRATAPEDSVWASRYRCEWGQVVGGRVRRLRAQAGLYLHDLPRMARRADGGFYSASFFSRLERGWASPPLFVYIALADAFDLHPGRLLGVDEAQKQVSDAELTVVRLIRRMNLAPEEAIERLVGESPAGYS